MKTEDYLDFEEKKEKIKDKINDFFDKKELSNEDREDITFEMFADFREHNRTDEEIEVDDDEDIEDFEDEIDVVDGKMVDEKTNEKVDEIPTPPKPKPSKLKQILGRK